MPLRLQTVWIKGFTSLSTRNVHVDSSDSRQGAAVERKTIVHTVMRTREMHTRGCPFLANQGGGLVHGEIREVDQRTGTLGVELHDTLI
jgi:hypothetical protein